MTQPHSVCTASGIHPSMLGHSWTAVEQRPWGQSNQAPDRGKSPCLLGR